MRSRKVFKFYATLSEEERVQLGLFLDSPYFGYNPRLSRFRQILEKELIKKPNNQLDCRTIWFMGVGTENFRPNGFDKLCAELLAAINEFIAIQSVRSNPLDMAAHLLAGCRGRDFEEWMPNIYQGLVEKFKPTFEMGNDALLILYKLKYSYLEHLMTQRGNPFGQEMQELDKALDQFYFSTKSELSHAMANYCIVYQDAIEIAHRDFLDIYLKEKDGDLPVVTKVFELSSLLIQSPKDSTYEELKSFAHQYSHQLRVNIRNPLWYGLHNHALRELKKGRKAYWAELDQLTEDMIRFRVGLDSGRISHNRFKNMIEVFLRRGRIEKGEAFFEEWKDKLTDDFDGLILVYTQSLFDFYMGRYPKCILGMEVVLRDLKQEVFFQNDARTYILMSLYEMSKVEDNSLELEARFNSLRVFLAREKRMGLSVKQSNENFLKLFRRLLTFNSLPDSQKKAKAPKLLAIVKETYPLNREDWFEMQLAPYL